MFWRPLDRLDDIGLEIHHQLSLYFFSLGLATNFFDNLLSPHKIVAVIPIDDKVFVEVDDNLAYHCRMGIPLLYEFFQFH